MLAKPETKAPVKKIVRLKRRKQVRNPRRLLESVPNDWAYWDQGAAAEGVNWSEYTRRALHAYTREVLARGKR